MEIKSSKKSNEITSEAAKQKREQQIQLQQLQIQQPQQIQQPLQFNNSPIISQMPFNNPLQMSIDNQKKILQYVFTNNICELKKMNIDYDYQYDIQEVKSWKCHHNFKLNNKNIHLFKNQTTNGNIIKTLEDKWQDKMILLMFACQLNYHEMIEYLASKTKNINQIDSFGNNALYYCIDIETIEILIKYKIDITIYNYALESPFGSRFSISELKRILIQSSEIEVQNKCLEKYYQHNGIDINKNYQIYNFKIKSETMLHTIRCKNVSEFIKYLLSSTKFNEILIPQNETILHIIVRFKLLQIFKDNINKLKQFINETGGLHNFTPLMFAAVNNDIDFIKILLENGADLYTRDDFGKIAFDYSDGEVRTLLQEHMTKRVRNNNDNNK